MSKLIHPLAIAVVANLLTNVGLDVASVRI